MERLSKVVSSIILATLLCLSLNSLSFATEIKPNKIVAISTKEAELEEREKAIEAKEKEWENREKARKEAELRRREKALDKKERELKVKSDKFTRAEQKKRQEEINRKKAEEKRQLDELKKSAEDAKGELESLKSEQEENAELQAKKDKTRRIWIWSGVALALLIIGVISAFLVIRSKRNRELQQEVYRQEDQIEDYRAKEAERERRSHGKNTISFIVIRDGVASGQLSSSFNDTLTIGRADGCGLRLDGEPTVSGHHCEIRSEGVVYSIRDLGSTNGTLLNGNPVKEATRIKNGDRLALGKLELVVVGVPENATASERV